MSTTPRRGRTPAKSKKSNRLAARTLFAKSFGIPLDEITDARAPVLTPWKSPLDRATYPRGGHAPTLTEAYEAWLSATVADLAAHYGNAYVDAQGSQDLKERTFVAAARILAATGAGADRR